MQTKLFNLLLTLTATLVIAGACSSRASDNKKENAVPVAAPAALPVDVKIIAAQSSGQSIEVAGSLLPNRVVDIMSETVKKIRSVNFRDGQIVGQGQLLYKLDDGEILAKIRQLQAELNLARINENRMRELLKSETVRQEEYDVAFSKLQTLLAARDILQVELSKTSIRAPFAGVAGISKAFAGTLVSPGMPLVSLQEQGSIKVQFSISEKYVALVKPGSQVEFSTESGTGNFKASIVSTEAAVDMQSRSITVQAITSNVTGKLKPGMSARIIFSTSAANEKALMIPTEALVPSKAGYDIFRVNKGMAKLTAVEVATRNEKEAMIKKGLEPGDTVIISNILRASDGIPVNIITKQ